MLYSCTHMATVGFKGLKSVYQETLQIARLLYDSAFYFVQWTIHEVGGKASNYEGEAPSE